MRVLLMSASYAPVVGGLQTMVAQLAAALEQAGHRVAVLTQRHPRTLPAAERVASVPVLRLLAVWPDTAQLRVHRPDLWLYGILSCQGQLRRLRRVIARFQPDVIHAHFAAGICAWLPDVLSFQTSMGVSQQAPLVLTVHGDDIEGLAACSPAEHARRLRLLRTAHAVTAPSQHLLHQAAPFAPQAALCVVPNGVDAAPFARAQPHTWPRPYIAAVGRLVLKKGFDLLLEAFAALDTFCDLLLAGDGPEREALQGHIARLGLLGRVCLLGTLDREATAALLKGARLVAIPSRQEPFGLVALEAWAAGASIVATTAGGLPEVLAGNGAIFAEPHSVTSLRDAMQQALQHSNEAPPLPTTFRWNNVVHQYEQIYAAHANKR